MMQGHTLKTSRPSALLGGRMEMPYIFDILIRLVSYKKVRVVILILEEA
jgi:hypothetical protein